jgi:hypothetical protein
MQAIKFVIINKSRRSYTIGWIKIELCNTSVLLYCNRVRVCKCRKKSHLFRQVFQQLLRLFGYLEPSSTLT